MVVRLLYEFSGGGKIEVKDFKCNDIFRCPVNSHWTGVLYVLYRLLGSGFQAFWLRIAFIVGFCIVQGALILYYSYNEEPQKIVLANIRTL